MAKYIMSITTTDRSGIIAGVSQALLDLDGNIQAASQTVHQGYFAMMVLADFAGEINTDELAERIHNHAGSDLHVYVTPYRPVEQAGPEFQSFIVTCEGPDRPGILSSLVNFLAGKSVNIDDLYCCVRDGNFVVICQVSVPNESDVYMLQAELESLGEGKGFAAHMQHENIFVATNDLRLGFAI